VKRCLASFALRFALAAALASVVALAPRVARAQSEKPALSLTWSAPPECPQEADARQLVADYLGEARLPPPPPGARVLRAVATIVRRERVWELRLETQLDGEPGERTLAAGTCADVAAAGALVLAFAIDPGAALRHRAVESPRPTHVVAPPPPRRAQSVRTVLGAAAGVRGDFGALPRPGVGIALSLLVERGRWSGLLTASAFAARSQATMAKPSAGGEISLLALGAEPCLSASRGSALELHLCVPFEWQRLRATGYGVDHPATASRSELLIGGELLPGLRLGPHLELIAPLRLAVALLRPEFFLEGIDSVFRASVVQGRVGVGLLARF
jgi:hypothetical protein